MLPAFCVPGLCLGSCFFSGPPKPVKARYDCCGLSSFGASISTNVFVASGFGIWFSVLVAVSSLTSLVSGSFFFSFLAGTSSFGAWPFIGVGFSWIGGGDMALLTSLFLRGSFLLFLLDISPFGPGVNPLIAGQDARGLPHLRVHLRTVPEA